MDLKKKDSFNWKINLLFYQCIKLRKIIYLVTQKPRQSRKFPVLFNKEIFAILFVDYISAGTSF